VPYRSRVVSDLDSGGDRLPRSALGTVGVFGDRFVYLNNYTTRMLCQHFFLDRYIFSNILLITMKKSISKQIRKMRLNANLSQGKLAAILGVSTAVVANWEVDRTRVPAEMYLKVEQISEHWGNGK